MSCGRIPKALEDAMSRQSQAARERQARNILGQVRICEIATRLLQLTYRPNPDVTKTHRVVVILQLQWSLWSVHYQLGHRAMLGGS